MKQRRPERPHNHDAERAVLAACIGPEGAGNLECLRLRLRAEDFDLVAHQIVYRALQVLASRGASLDLVALCDELTARGELERVGDRPGVVALCEYSAPWALASHSGIVRQCALRRRMIIASLELHDAAHDKTVPIEDLIAMIRTESEAIGREQEAPAPLTYLDLAAIRERGLPPVPWLLPGWLAEGDITHLVGGPFIGKSTIAAAMGYSLATGTSWCGIQPTRACRVLVFDEEQSDVEVARMYLRAGAPCEGLSIAAQQSISVTAPDGLALLERELREKRPEVVIGDSVQQLMAGIDENSASEVGPVYKTLFRLRGQYGATFLLLGHPGKPNTQNPHRGIDILRGSTAHGTQASSVWIATRSQDGGAVDLRQVKRRGGGLLKLRVRYHAEHDDAPVTLTGEPLDDTVALAAKSKGRGGRTRQRVLEALIALGRAATSTDVHVRIGSKTPAEPTVRKHLHALVESGNAIDAGERGGRGGAKLWIANVADSGHAVHGVHAGHAQNQSLWPTGT